MRVLLDENVPRRVQHALTQHDVHTVRDLGWEGIQNGELIERMEAERIDVFVTRDKNVPKQQNLTGRHVTLVVMSATNWPVIRKHLQEIAEAVNSAKSGGVSTINCGAFRPRR